MVFFPYWPSAKTGYLTIGPQFINERLNNSDWCPWWKIQYFFKAFRTLAYFF